ncbi:MAG: anaerobic ribonucleoside-triphosphate reductase activating protein [Lachnospiraceae bacterium]|nr:anaerobic ribonucleoside-triphosphate reductase activating protein [Lachnospiraceae bacterium]
MNYADIKQYDIANGPGVRVSVFVSGCTRACPGCFNREAWDFSYGKLFTRETVKQVLSYLSPDYVRGLSLLGGEPFEHENQKGLLPFLRCIREKYPKKDIWCFTGYLFDEDICDRMCVEWKETKEFLSYIDVLVDGQFVEALHNVNLHFKGSSNQRTIMVQESLREGKIILWEPPVI